jgi:hypothetical protein
VGWWYAKQRPRVVLCQKRPKGGVFKDINTRGPYMIGVSTDNVVYPWSDENVAFTGRTGDNTVPRYLHQKNVLHKTFHTPTCMHSHTSCLSANTTTILGSFVILSQKLNFPVWWPPVTSCSAWIQPCLLRAAADLRAADRRRNSALPRKVISYFA